MTRLVLRIDRLVLQGFAPDDRQAIAAALQAELARQLATPDAAARLMVRGHTARLRLDPIALAEGAGAAAIGERLADGISRGLNQ